MCVCDTQVGAGLRISTEYVTAVVPSGTGHSGIVTRVPTITYNSAVITSRTCHLSVVTGSGLPTITVNNAVLLVGQIISAKSHEE